MSADVGKLVDLAYSAAVDDALWRDWAEELTEQLGSPGALFYVIDPDRFDMCRSHICFRDRDNDLIDHEYNYSGIVADDPQMHRVCTVKRSEIYLDTDHVDIELVFDLTEEFTQVVILPKAEGIDREMLDYAAGLASEHA